MKELFQTNRDQFIKFINYLKDLIFIMEVISERDFRYIIVNDAAKKVLTVPNIIGLKIEDVVSKQDAKFLIEKYREVVINKKENNFVARYQKDKYGETVLSPIFNEENDVAYIIGVTRDITARHLYEEKIRHLAFYDSLTGLPNRELFNRDINRAIENANRRKSKLAMLYIDCDNLKPVNDQYGHDVGDQFLIEVAKRLQRSVRINDSVARIGGDEFTILLSEINNNEDILKIVHRIYSTMKRDWIYANIKVDIHISLGIAVFPTHAKETDRLLKKADMALYKAKQCGGNCYCFSDG
ncbi:hypothetical protein BKP45_01490 [Anaerobacillus alkalidiazotrophicus]|uniref:GGDEF domain-containing protein n=1 Tax=Anaerobacillus alkalidiazotrophicus TaxID=472963 RepID=A0A1S2M9U1_9BACI|nr:sensor domain-containing diguanylate cyclase [Anaerobacillus alkalidiazotrophicus]OIJ21471.1 hypothetical protein BKP45_01490 [Anaerobacillus alkalidiazotrophicus]